MLVDETARNASLDNDYGPTRGPNAADSHEVVLLDADGFELEDATSPGYARVTVESDDWPAAEDGQKTLVVDFPAPTGEWVSAVAWQLVAAGDVVWDQGQLLDVLYVTTASDAGPSVAVTIAYQIEL